MTVRGREVRASLVVAGGGSGGIGAALAAARLGLDTILIEKEPIPGGTSTVGGVNSWEPVAGATGIPYDIYRELSAIPGAAGIYSMARHRCRPERNRPPFPGGEALIDPDRTYADTLRRSGTGGLPGDAERCFRQWHGVVFEPEPFCRVVLEMLERTGCCRVMLHTRITGVTMRSPGVIDRLTLDDGTTVRAGLWIDNGGVLARYGGAELLTGEDPRDRFGEPDAPETPRDDLNGVTLLFRIVPRDEERIDPLPAGIPSGCWWADAFPAMFCVRYPGGDRNCNMLPTMRGREYRELGEEKADAECRRRVIAYWHHLQSDYPEFRRYRLGRMFDRVGVRETFRVMSEYMLNENDLLAGIGGQRHHDIIALSDHMMDSHGVNARKSGELREPYGIPYRCLIPRGFANLLTAGRIAGFSSIAASSCRLSRTMMQLGQAAGTAAALAHRHGLGFRDIDPVELRARLREQQVQLDWPPR